MTATVASIQHLDHHHTARPGTRPSAAGSAEPSRRAVRAGRILSGLAILFLLFDATLKLMKLAPAVEGTIQLGYPADVIRVLGFIQIGCLVAYLIPRTSLLGAILWTGYLGGAIATHVRVGSPLFSHILFPVYVAALLWAGLWLRDKRLRALLAW